MSSTGENVSPPNRWRQQLETLLVWKQSWLLVLIQYGVESADTAIDIEPSSEPPGRTAWNWWITFTLKGVELDALGAEDLSTLLFEDEDGRFEVPVAVDRVPQYLMARLGR